MKRWHREALNYGRRFVDAFERFTDLFETFVEELQRYNDLREQDTADKRGEH